MTKKEAAKKRRQKAQALAAKQQQGMEGLLPLKRPAKFKDTEAVCDFAKGAVYQITRLRNGYSATLGTGFLVGKNRMMTCAHCINNPEVPNAKMSHHQDGDVYCLYQLDENNDYHYAVVPLTLNQDLFVYPAQDVAIIYLQDDFYGAEGEYYQHPDKYLELSMKPRNIGSEIVILGYPINQLTFDSDGYPQQSSVIFRGDFGVVNTRYIEDAGDGTAVEQYHFTVPFNPGNSGGPIIDKHSGKVIGIVKGSLSIPVRQVEDEISDLDKQGNSVTYVQKSIVKTTYSVGFSSRNCESFAAEHGIPLSNET